MNQFQEKDPVRIQGSIIAHEIIQLISKDRFIKVPENSQADEFINESLNYFSQLDGSSLEKIFNERAPAWQLAAITMMHRSRQIYGASVKVAEDCKMVAIEITPVIPEIYLSFSIGTAPAKISQETIN